MGLDQYAYFLNEEETINDKEQEDFYWRKHNRLQGWMENLWESKGGDGEFNVTSMELTEEDLTTLQMDIENQGLPETSGFFYGNDSYDDYKGEYGYYEKDKQFVEGALSAVREGKRVVYYCWW